MKASEKAFNVERRFAVAKSPWSNSMCERMMREVLHTLNGMLQEGRRARNEWVDLVPAV